LLRLRVCKQPAGGNDVIDARPPRASSARVVVVLATIVAVHLGVLASGCDAPAGAGGAGAALPPAPAELVREGDLNVITLTEDAESRLGIRVVEIERRALRRSRLLGGEVEVAAGKRVMVAAPFAGIIAEPAGGGSAGAATLTGVPAPGSRIARGQPVLALLPLLAAESRAALASSRAEAEGAREAARVEGEAAKVALARAEEVFKARSGSQRDVDEARARLLGAEAAERAAESRRTLLEALENGGSAAARAGGVLSIEAPLAGVVEALHALPGQAVPAGAPLFAVAAHERLWVRVPVYAGDLSGVDAGASARIAAPGGLRTGDSRAGAPAMAPPAADPDAATVDLVYEVENRDGALRPGEKVEVAVPLRSETESLVVPWSAVLHDAHGGAWVYVRAGERRFARRRVEVVEVVDGVAVLGEGALRALVMSGVPGSEAGGVMAGVVAEGAAELFSTEFGAAK
jgi:hypothetical protein